MEHAEILDWCRSMEYHVWIRSFVLFQYCMYYRNVSFFQRGKLGETKIPRFPEWVAVSPLYNLLSIYLPYSLANYVRFKKPNAAFSRQHKPYSSATSTFRSPLQLAKTCRSTSINLQDQFVSCSVDSSTHHLITSLSNEAKETT